MKQLLTLFGVLIFNISYACDFCGSFMGITPYDNQSSITMLYRYKSYSGYFNAIKIVNYFRMLISQV